MIELGAAVRPEWGLDAGAVTVNHGSYGATPLCVLRAQDEWRRRMEAQPTRFMRSELPGAIRDAAGVLAGFLGARGEDVAFVDNASEACNAVLRSIVLREGDEVLVLGHVYGAVRNTVLHVTGRAGARMVTAPLPFPRPADEDILASIAACLTERTRIAVIDHITSSSALVLPLKQIVALCHAHGVKVLVDGAHAPGHVELDLTALDADWYAGNCHKWLCSPKGAGFLWARADRQDDLHPVVISHGYGQGFVAEFDWTGTRDPSARLAVPAALEFHRRLGGAALRQRNIALASEAAAMLAGVLGTEIGHGNRPAGAMAMIRLGLSGEVSDARALAIRTAFEAEGCDVPVMAHHGSAWLRVSAQAYNDMADYTRLAEIARAVTMRGI
jgi:isopenicillin-N epimerase